MINYPDHRVDKLLGIHNSMSPTVCMLSLSTNAMRNTRRISLSNKRKGDFRLILSILPPFRSVQRLKCWNWSTELIAELTGGLATLCAWAWNHMFRCWLTLWKATSNPVYPKWVIWKRGGSSREGFICEIIGIHAVAGSYLFRFRSDRFL